MDLDINQKLKEAITVHQEGRLEEAERLYRETLEIQPNNLNANNNLGVILKHHGKLEEAEKCYRKVIEIKPDFAEGYNNLGNTISKLNKIDQAEQYYRKAIEIKPDYTQAYYNLASLLHKLEKLDEAVGTFKKAIELKPDYMKAYFNLGIIQDYQDKPEEAEISFRKTIELKPDHAEAYNNLATVLQQLDRLDEAEISYKKAIELKPDYAEAYNNLGSLLYNLNNFDEAEEYYKKAIKINHDYANVYFNLGRTLQEVNKLEEAEISYKKAIEINPDYIEANFNLDSLSRHRFLLGKIHQSKNFIKKNQKTYTNTSFNSKNRLATNPFIANRQVEPELIRVLYKVNFLELDKIKSGDINKKIFNDKEARYGNGKCSDFRLFKNDISIIKDLEKDLTTIMSQAVKSDIFIMDSFVNIYASGSGTIPHVHIKPFDKANGLVNQKFSLTYYLDIGDQNCDEPGIFKMYNPNEEFLPSKGMISIIPANRMHAASYRGKKDRVMIGVNFYSLL